MNTPAKEAPDTDAQVAARETDPRLRALLYTCIMIASSDNLVTPNEMEFIASMLQSYLDDPSLTRRDILVMMRHTAREIPNLEEDEFVKAITGQVTDPEGRQGVLKVAAMVMLIDGPANDDERGCYQFLAGALGIDATTAETLQAEASDALATLSAQVTSQGSVAGS